MEEFQRVIGWCEITVGNREGHFGAVFSQKRAGVFISQRGWNRGRLYNFRPLLYQQVMEVFLFIRPLQNVLKSNVV